MPLEREQVPDKAAGQVVHAEVAQVLEDVHRLGAPGTAHARDDDDLGHILERDRILFARPLSAVLVLVSGIFSRFSCRDHDERPFVANDQFIFSLAHYTAAITVYSSSATSSGTTWASLISCQARSLERS